MEHKRPVSPYARAVPGFCAVMKVLELPHEKHPCCVSLLQRYNTGLPITAGTRAPSVHCKLKVKVLQDLAFSMRITTASAWTRAQLQQQPSGTESLSPFSCELPLQFLLFGLLMHKVWCQPWVHKDGSHFLICKSHQYKCLFFSGPVYPHVLISVCPILCHQNISARGAVSVVQVAHRPLLQSLKGHQGDKRPDNLRK